MAQNQAQNSRRGREPRSRKRSGVQWPAVTTAERQDRCARRFQVNQGASRCQKIQKLGALMKGPCGGGFTLFPVSASAPRPERDLRRDPPGRTDANRAQLAARLVPLGKLAKSASTAWCAGHKNEHRRASRRRQAESLPCLPTYGSTARAMPLDALRYR